ncbi:hypothetical protein BUALT_Bualt08G0093800 [Buddleja alternifolia]|uniref:SNRNP25 ubiquitin-like domain-containing protein n=1 Tax=Buddleja alternifolia TaxID=168488 RepID=A0AAV6XBI1_9LAMI|nr:hypothetical protein BUALT_Bualt08G0093800 [Buddleja alternifolia]
MDASTDGTTVEGGGTPTAAADPTPEYNSSVVKKARLQSTLAALLNDPVLADVPKKPSVSDVDTLINLELGSAMRIAVLKLDGTSFGTSIYLSSAFSQTPCYQYVNAANVSVNFGCIDFYLLDFRFWFGCEDVAVMSNATVKDLKLAIKKKVNEVEESKMGHRHISWKHVWANFCLSHHNEKLLDDSSALQDYGVRNNSQVQFIPYVVARNSRKHSRRRKHRFFHGLNRKS